MTPAWRFYLGLYAGSRRTILLATFASLLQAALVLPITWLLRGLFDGHGLPHGIGGTLATALGVVLLYLAGDAIQLWATHATLGVTKGAILRFREHLIAAAYALPRGHTPAGEVGRLHAAMVSDAERLDDMSNALISRLLPAFFSALGLVTVLAVLNWRLALVALVVLPAAWATTRAMRRPLRTRIDRFHRVFEDFSTGALAALQRRDLARIHGAEAMEMAVQGRHLRALREAGHRVAWIATANNVVQTEVAVISGIVVLVAGSALIASGHLTLGMLIAFYFILGLLRSHLGVLVAQAPSLAAGTAALTRLHAIVAAREAPAYRGTQPIAFTGAVTVRDVAFDYGGSPVLRAASIQVHAGAVTALGGASGAGKTTLVLLILGLLRPSKGALLADGRPYDDIAMADLRAGIGYAVQDPPIFAGTVRDNLLFGLADAPVDLAPVLAIAGATAMVAGLDEGLDTWLGDSGARLSGGQRQRLSIARAVLRRPRLLILDEPTNHLGTAEIRALLARFRAACPAAAILVISHDPEMLAAADQGYRLADGVLAPL